MPSSSELWSMLLLLIVKIECSCHRGNKLSISLPEDQSFRYLKINPFGALSLDLQAVEPVVSTSFGIWRFVLARRLIFLLVFRFMQNYPSLIISFGA
mmetsp:Transcript_18011/g.27537  ORF Transcript_18011/g.27537 Transcript_18011/m.27537 type:complete len:97 (-) Transcript_18011:272-562(-)